MPSETVLKKLVDALEYESRPLTGKEIRSQYREYNGNKFSDDFPKPSAGVTFTDYLVDIITTASLPIHYDPENSTFAYKKPQPPPKQETPATTDKPVISIPVPVPSTKPERVESDKSVSFSPRVSVTEVEKVKLARTDSSAPKVDPKTEKRSAATGFTVSDKEVKVLANVFKNAIHDVHVDNASNVNRPSNGKSSIPVILSDTKEPSASGDFDAKPSSLKKNEIRVERLVGNQSKPTCEPDVPSSKIKELPDRLMEFYSDLGRKLQSIDYTKIDEISAKFGRLRPLNHKKYGFENNKQLLLSIPGFYESKGPVSPKLFFSDAKRLRQASENDENNNPAYKPRLSPNAKEFRPFLKEQVVRNDNKLENVFIQAVYAMSKLQDVMGAEFYANCLEELGKCKKRTGAGTVNELTQPHKEFIAQKFAAFSRELCLSKYPHFPTLEKLTALALNELKDKSCEISKLGEILAAKSNEITSNSTKSIPSLVEVAAQVQAPSVRELVNVMEGLKLSEGRVYLAGDS